MSKGTSSRRRRRKRRLKPLSRLSKRQLRRRVHNRSSDDADDECDSPPRPGSPSSLSTLSTSDSASSESKLCAKVVEGDAGFEIDDTSVEDVGAGDDPWCDAGDDPWCGAGDDPWCDAEENRPDPDCPSCMKCLCLDCASCFHSRAGCKHCERCLLGVVYESDFEPEDDESDDYLIAGDESEDESDDDSSEESDQEAEQVQGTLAASLRHWVNTFKVPFLHVTALLKILVAAQVTGLPKDARTLMRTPRSTVIRSMLSGTYWHNGLSKGLQHILKGSGVAAVDVSVNVDGLPLSKSSGSQLWPILCSVLDKVFLAGVYHGDKKPDDTNVFLDEFVNEAREVVTEGVVVDGRKVDVVVKKLVCDAPAKSGVMKVPGHGAYDSCTKCKVEGIYKNHRIAFPDLDADLRTDLEFQNKSDPDHHTGTSKMLQIPGFGGVTNVVLDYMHLVCLGVMRKLLLLWVKGPLKTRVGNAYIARISDVLTKISGLKPREFCRPPRSLKYVLQFKATEFRQLLLYTGPAVLHDCLPPDLYLNFLKLHAAIVILCSPKFAVLEDFLCYANDLLRNFVEDFSDLYGEEFVSHNVHNLIHLVLDVKNFGPLDNFSAFPFENYMQHIKKLVRKPSKVLAQLSRRIAERETYLPVLLKKKRVLEPHSGGILPRTCINPQYQRIHFQDYVLDLGEPNNCCSLAGGEVVVVENFATCLRTKSVVVVGRVFEEKLNLYDQPLPSSVLGIFKVQKLGRRLQIFPVDDIVAKYWKIPIGVDGAFAVIPLLHQETPNKS